MFDKALNAPLGLSLSYENPMKASCLYLILTNSSSVLAFENASSARVGLLGNC